MHTLEDKKMSVKVAWSSGHADIMGNLYADKLAKEATQEATNTEELPEELLCSMGDIKYVVKESVN